MTADEILSALKGALPDSKAEATPAIDCPAITVPRDELVATLKALREIPALRFMLLSELTAVDWWPAEPRFQVVYNLTSIDNRLRLRLKVPIGGDDARVPTVIGMWPGANWLEREVFDLFGIVFEGHPDLRRVLMPEDWEGHPLRKDYPVQIKMPVQIYAPLQMTEEEFERNIANDRDARAEIKRESK